MVTTSLTTTDLLLVLSRVPRMRFLVGDAETRYLPEPPVALALLGLLREVDPLAIVDGVEFLDQQGLMELQQTPDEVLANE